VTNPFQLESSGLIVRGDAGHGGEILDLIDRRDGQQLLGRPPVRPTVVVSGELDEPTWTRCYRGGWQLLAPNAGNACWLAGKYHGFHGRACTEPWRLESQGRSVLRLTWEGHGLRLEREIVLEQDELQIRTRARVVSDRQQFILVEHCTLGPALIRPGLKLELPSGTAFELSETEGPITAPSAASKWPQVRMLDGRRETAGDWHLDRPMARFIAVEDLPGGWAQVRNVESARRFELSWNTDVLPHLWVWLENRVTEQPWGGEAQILGLEPASVPHSLGLTTAAENEQAFSLRRGVHLEWEITARVERDG
jgi:hypothetical protein